MLPLSIGHEVSVEEARRQHDYASSVLALDLCPEVAAETYRGILRYSGAISRIRNYDGGVPQEIISVYMNEVNAAKSFMKKIRHPAVSELVGLLEDVQTDISRYKTY